LLAGPEEHRQNNTTDDRQSSDGTVDDAWLDRQAGNGLVLTGTTKKEPCAKQYILISKLTSTILQPAIIPDSHYHPLLL
jgi:hypothetical protein